MGGGGGGGYTARCIIWNLVKGLLVFISREVRVIRLICKGTVEEHILQCAEVKLKLEQDISKMNGKIKNAKSLSMRDHRDEEVIY